MQVSYSHASARIVLDATGVHTPQGLVSGRVVLNVTNGKVRSLGIYDRSTRKVIQRLDAASVKGNALSFGSKRDQATLDGFSR